MSSLILKNVFRDPFFKDALDLMELPLRVGALTFPKNPHYEVYKENDKFIAVFNMPGHTGLGDVKAEVDKETGVLRVESKKSEEKKEEKEGRYYYHKGEMTSKFAISLPEDIDLESAQAQCENGQLKVTFNFKNPEILENEQAKILSIPIGQQIKA